MGQKQAKSLGISEMVWTWIQELRTNNPSQMYDLHELWYRGGDGQDFSQVD